ncbi:hypothetical protein FY528_13930 [Hymenobacter lutimineralis]|uniref:Uncharacterized protein n=1 Tax=Hymenobacter lutimineralis TaxID=2606448 RepID=A0A5D6UYN0_9BACT|nr:MULTISPECIES: hypothetical protein [Hymenobacter]QIX63230.1 hypothetical protein HER32_19455 [Hymenobacter sp. BT18]TYZ07792.1 hypothetical protein FY528_13930 [Hymenobacter lutimineralis]
MNKVLSLAALLIALGLILFLYQQLNTTEKALQLAEKRFADCEQVNFQLQNQLTLIKRGAVPDSLKAQ